MLFYRGRQRILDADGAPVPGAKANFYVSLTNNRQDTYQDAALTIAHSNPVAADDYGFLPPIYLDPALVYKCVITDRDDVALPDGTLDPLVQAAFSQSAVGAALNPRTEVEVLANVTPVDYAYVDGNSARYSDLQVWADSFGTTASMHGGENVLEGGAHTLTSTLIINRKSGVFRGEGPGSAQNGTGSVLVWNGVAGNPMISIRQCWGLRISDLRLKGKSTAKPSAAIIVDTSTSSPSPTALNFTDIWIGTFGSFDSDNVQQFTDGLVVDGSANLQGDQSEISHITVQSVTEACIAFRNSQNTLWYIHTATLNLAKYGIEVGTRHITAKNIFCQTVSTADYYLPIDASLTVEGFGSELGGRLCQAVDGFDLTFRRGYFQAATASVAASGRIVDLTSTGIGSVTFEDVLFYAVGGYSGPTLKFYARGTKLFIKLKNVSIPSAPDTFFDIATTTSGDSRHVILENVIDNSGVVYNGNFYWVHGDYSPSFNTEALGQQHKIVLYGSATFDPASTADEGVEATTVTVTGARVGDFAEATLSTIASGWYLVATVISDNNVRVLMHNRSGSTDDLASGTLRVKVTKF